MHSPRLLFAAPASGSGKTTLVCGLLRSLQRRGLGVRALKCGPDYIDPLFHETVIGVPSGTMDLFFSHPDQLRRLYAAHASQGDVTLIEGVMGYYDGLGAASLEASSFQVAQALDAPVVLILDGRGQSLSALATLTGFLAFRPDSRIRGVIFNRMSEGVYAALRPQVEAMGLVPLGYVPKSDDLMLQSRHLGLVTPGEVANLSEKLNQLAALLERTLDIDALLSLARQAGDLSIPPAPAIPPMPKSVIAVARDEAFCFLYRDNLALLEAYGATLRFFSPLHDRGLPPEAGGLILPGGYPELYARALSQNTSMLSAIKTAIAGGMPTLAECGGFMYLHRELTDLNEDTFPLVGLLEGRAYPTGKLGRFGYITLTPQRDTAFLPRGESVKGHEFHYFDSTLPGDALWAQKPTGNRGWACAHDQGMLLAGFPHLFYPSNPRLAERFLRAAAKEN